jgi:hypothetical protein
LQFPEEQFHTYMSQSMDGVTWTAGTKTNVAIGTNSVEVKWPSAADEFVMIEIVNQFAGASLIYQTSTDGSHLDRSASIAGRRQLPDLG